MYIQLLSCEQIFRKQSVSGNNQKLVSQLHQELFDYLREIGARFPKQDPEYSAEAEQNILIVWKKTFTASGGAAP